MTLLQDRVAAFVADHPRSTFKEIARGVKGSDAAVRDVLRSELFSASPPPAHSSDEPQTFWLGSDTPDARSRPDKPVSGTTLLLQTLLDREWHDTAGLRRRSNVVVNSAIVKLRERGYRIDRRGGGSRHEYRLVGTPSDAAAAQHPVAVSPGALDNRLGPDTGAPV